MQERKWNILIGTMSYGGNGSFQSEHPKVGRWLTKAVLALKADPRIDKIADIEAADTPVTLCRNKIAKYALDNGFDFCLMVDSDQDPDMYIGHDSSAKPFLQSSLDFLIDRWDSGYNLIFAPYCGPAPHPVASCNQPVYVFDWEALQEDQTNPHLHLRQFTRNEAARARGIMEVAAGPTGLILIDCRIFKHLPKPLFYYEWEKESDGQDWQARKASTEDVTFTRDASSAGCGVYCNWDAWAGHIKPQTVGKPTPLSNEYVRDLLKDAIINGVPRDAVTLELNPGKSLDQILRDLGASPQDVVQPKTVEIPAELVRREKVLLSDSLPPKPNGDGH